MNFSNLDLRTPLQKERDDRNSKIISEYNEAVLSLPEDTSKWAICRALAQKHGLKPQGIRAILKKHNKLSHAK